MAVDPTQGKSFPDCTRCGHSFEEHERPPSGTKLPWPCSRCDCPGFVVSRDLQEDVRYMATLRLENAVAELYGRHLDEFELHAIVDDVIARMEESDAPDPQA